MSLTEIKDQDMGVKGMSEGEISLFTFPTTSIYFAYHQETSMEHGKKVTGV